VLVGPLEDIYRIRHATNHYELSQYLLPDTSYPPLNFPLSEEKIGFLLFPMIKDNHATAFFSIVDTQNHRVLASVFINSSPEGQQSWGNMEFRYNRDDDYRYEMSSAGQESHPFLKSRPKKKVPNDQNYEDFAMMFVRRTKELVVNRKIPLIDATHPIQVQSDDMNCALYSLNFLNAIAQLTKTQGQTIYGLAMKVNQGSNGQKQQASQALSRIFREDLKKFLPQYYDSYGRLKSKQSIKDFHLRQRWDMASDVIKSTVLQN
jgi:hypothetical protein